AHRPLRPGPRHRALEAERTVGEALDRMDGLGIRVLHSIPLPGGDRVHHLAIGPGGLYAIHTVYARRQRVTVADPLVTLGRREPHALLRRVRADAERVSYALTAEVRPVLALVGASHVTVSTPPRGVRVLTDGEVEGLGDLGGVLKPADVEALYAMARDRNTWTRL
ncbi:nuclease-related domain-containing protein, partial [Streptomyces prasinopilosus]|uniref:nuclease-related domain-containing protein n=1 Tax=Streptomyces prasinopilosus TaxID=67344 RepID=UPI000ADE4CDA